MKDLYIAPMNRSSFVGIFWPAYNRGSIWLYNVPEALHGLREGQKRGCHQPELCWRCEGDTVVAETDPDNADPQAHIELRFDTDESGFDITLRVRNTQSTPYLDDAIFDACLRNNAAMNFQDPKGERTFVRKGGSWISLFELFGDEAITRARGISLGVPDAAADEGIIARLNGDGTHLIATAWDEVVKVAANLGPPISCIHSDPLLGPLEPGETVTRRGRIWLLTCSLEELYDVFRADVASG